MKKRRMKRIQAYVMFYFMMAGIVATAALFVFLFVLLVKEIASPKQAAVSAIAGVQAEGADAGMTAKPANSGTALGVSFANPFIQGDTDDGNPASGKAHLGEMPADSINSPLLVLVNREHPIPDDYDANLRKICNGRVEASSYLYDDLCAMLKAAGKDGYEYWIASGYRTKAYQEENINKDIENYRRKGYSYDEAVERAYEYKLPAGCSEHHTGLALDLLCSTNTAMDISQADEAGNAWLRVHCWEYGFILRYPNGREDITGIKYEPWHFRYVGREAAEYMTKNGLVLEEYVSLLNNMIEKNLQEGV